jgi:hypothetical protein
MTTTTKSAVSTTAATVSTALMPKIAKRTRGTFHVPGWPVSLANRDLFNLPWEDVFRHSESANNSLTDLIELGPLATRALGRLYAEFGVSGTPTNWGQLMGSFCYCKEVNNACNRPYFGDEDSAIMFRAVIKTARDYSPELVDSYFAYREKRVDDLRELFTKNLGLQACFDYFDQDEGWGGPGASVHRKRPSI